MKKQIEKYLLYSSVFAIFTESFFFHFIIDLKLLYLIIISNYFLLLHIKKLTIDKYFVLVIIFIAIHGFIVNTAYKIPYNFMVSQIIGIAIVGVYYYNFVKLFPKQDLINLYLKICLFIAVIGYPMYFLNINLNDGRLQSIFKEPAHYVVVVIPACYYYLKTKKYLPFAIIFGTLILSGSSLGYIGCALFFILPNITWKRVGFLLLLIPFVYGVFSYLYKEYPFFKLRVDDTYNNLKVVNHGKFEPYTNLSSYAILSNVFITKTNVKEHPFGTGIGSHFYMYTKVYFGYMTIPPYVKIIGRHKENAPDANSLFLRISSEFGIFGLLFLLFIIYYCSKSFYNDDLFFAQGIFIYLMLKLFRDGHYFPPEFYFFVWLLYFYMKDFYKNYKLQYKDL